MIKSISMCSEGCSYHTQSLAGSGWDLCRCPECTLPVTVRYIADSFQDIQSGVQLADCTLTGVIGCFYEEDNQGFFSSSIQGQCICIEYPDGQNLDGETCHGFCYAEIV